HHLLVHLEHKSGRDHVCSLQGALVSAGFVSLSSRMIEWFATWGSSVELVCPMISSGSPDRLMGW
ncbi:hypothetical protein, partial [Pannonibacter sp. I15F10I1]|uniref:hypothetical protein n=1 Tax=Pannonibacter sp. I15F10I1 TaxID=2003580 RepID=UPI001AD913B2